MNEWTNWSRRVRCEPREIIHAATVDDIVTALRRARAEAVGVRVVGSGHSFAPLVVTDGLLLSLDAIAGIESIDVAGRTAWIRAGTKLCDIGEPLARMGLALANQGDIDQQSLAGAIATGTHGTGATLGSLSTQVMALRAVDADGNIVEWPEASGACLSAARAALGTLGVVTAAQLALVPTYWLHERTWYAWPDDCLDQLDTLVGGNRHFEFFWYPRPDACELKTLNPTAAGTSAPSHSPGERIGPSWQVFPSVRQVRFNEMEYAVERSAGPACFREIAARIKRRHPAVIWPVEYRTLAADDIWLSQAYHRESVTISIHQDARVPCDDFFRDMETVFAAYGGRPHFGKVHFRPASDLRGLYPQWEDFHAVRRTLDPQGRFMNAHLTRIFIAP